MTAPDDSNNSTAAPTASGGTNMTTPGSASQDAQKLELSAHGLLASFETAWTNLFGKASAEFKDIVNKLRGHATNEAQKVAEQFNQDVGDVKADVQDVVSSVASDAEQAAKDMNNPDAPGTGTTPTGTTGEASASK